MRSIIVPRIEAWFENFHITYMDTLDLLGCQRPMPPEPTVVLEDIMLPPGDGPQFRAPPPASQMALSAPRRRHPAHVIDDDDDEPSAN